MATTYPDAVQTFPAMENMTATDAALVKQYQTAMADGNVSLANTILVTIADYQKKIVNADYFNTINDTIVALQKKFNEKYSPGITISASAPSSPATDDYWWGIV